MSKYFIITLINLLIFNNIYAFSYTSLDASPESDAIDWSKKKHLLRKNRLHMQNQRSTTISRLSLQLRKL